MITKEHLHRLVEELPESEWTEAARLLATLRRDDQVLQAIRNAPYDDEPETAEEAAAVQAGRDDVAAGRVVSHAEAQRRLLGQP